MSKANLRTLARKHIYVIILVKRDLCEGPYIECVLGSAESRFKLGRMIPDGLLGGLGL